jgi:hypothetical protein
MPAPENARSARCLARDIPGAAPKGCPEFAPAANCRKTAFRETLFGQTCQSSMLGSSLNIKSLGTTPFPALTLLFKIVVSWTG